MSMHSLHAMHLPMGDEALPPGWTPPQLPGITVLCRLAICTRDGLRSHAWGGKTSGGRAPFGAAKVSFP